jgi:hypothetical protein
MTHNTFTIFYEIPQIPFDFEDNIQNFEIFFFLLKLNNPDNQDIIEIEKETFRQKNTFHKQEVIFNTHLATISSLRLDMFNWNASKKEIDYWHGKHLNLSNTVLVNKYKWKDAVDKYLGKKIEIVKIIL